MAALRTGGAGWEGLGLCRGRHDDEMAGREAQCAEGWWWNEMKSRIKKSARVWEHSPAKETHLHAQTPHGGHGRSGSWAPRALQRSWWSSRAANLASCEEKEGPDSILTIRFDPNCVEWTSWPSETGRWNLWWGTLEGAGRGCSWDNIKF